MWFKGYDTCTKTAATRKHGILQGCPWSMVLLAGIMTLFMHYVEGEAPMSKWGLYVDDRLVWAEGARAGEEVTKAIEAAKYFDMKWRFKWNEGKGSTFASSKRGQRENAAKASDKV